MSWAQACHAYVHMYHTAVGVCTGVAVTALSSLCFIYTDLLVFSLGGKTVSWMAEKQFPKCVPLQKSIWIHAHAALLSPSSSVGHKDLISHSTLA